MPTARNRYYSAPPATHNVDMTYGWSDTATITGSANTVTGAWIPISLTADGSLNVGGISFTGTVNTQSGSFTPNFAQIIGTGQTQIPAGVRSYCISVVSGYAFINGVGPVNAYTNIPGGGFDGDWILGSPINVGGTGTVADPVNIFVSYEA